MRIAALVMILVMLVGCRQSAPSNTVELKIALEASTFAAGKSELVISVKDGQGNPIDNATVEVTGDMNHAGMKPVFGTAQHGEQGQYRVPIDWTMGGDWILTVKVTLPDGRTASQRFDVLVIS